MKTRTPNRIAEIQVDLARLADRLAGLNVELEKAPAWKRTTRWWADRVGARQQLLRQRDELRTEARELVAAN